MVRFGLKKGIERRDHDFVGASNGPCRAQNAHPADHAPIRVGDPAQVRLMGDSRIVRGHVKIGFTAATPWALGCALETLMARATLLTTNFAIAVSQAEAALQQAQASIQNIDAQCLLHRHLVSSKYASIQYESASTSEIVLTPTFTKSPSWASRFVT
jgi:hypothetical protein